MTKKEIGEALRMKRDVTKTKFAELSGLGRPQIDAIEKGGGYTMDSLMKYCKAVKQEIRIVDEGTGKKIVFIR